MENFKFLLFYLNCTHTVFLSQYSGTLKTLLRSTCSVYVCTVHSTNVHMQQNLTGHLLYSVLLKVKSVVQRAKHFIVDKLCTLYCIRIYI